LAPVAVAFALAVAMLGTTLPAPLYVLYRERFGFSELTITVIFATYAAGVIASLLLFGRLSDQIGRRRVLLPGLALSALSAVAFLLAHGLALLLVGRILSGLSAGIFTGTATATLVDLATPERRGRATLMATVANMGGLGAGPLLAGLLAQWAGSPLRLAFYVDVALVLVASIGIWAMPEPVTARSRPRLRPQRLTVPREMRRTFWNAALAGFAGFAVLGLFTAVAPAFLGQELGVTSSAVVGLVVFAAFAGSMIGQAVVELLPKGAAMPAGCLALIAGMVSLALGLALTAMALFVLGGVIAGFGHGLSFRAGLAAVNASAPGERRGQAASSFFVVMYVAISVPVIGEGVLAEAIGLRPAGMIFAAAVAGLAAVAFVLLRRQRGSSSVALAHATVIDKARMARAAASMTYDAKPPAVGGSGRRSPPLPR
jgi:MFS family permease